MPHAINIDAVSESLFLLQSLVHASNSYCATYKIRRSATSTGEVDWSYYQSWLKTSICDDLVRASIAIRIIQDILLADEERERGLLRGYHNHAVDGLDLGQIDSRAVPLTLREACNKVIHARDVQLDWRQEPEFEWWSGSVQLSGSHRRVRWTLRLHVEAFAIAGKRYIDSISDDADWCELYHT